ncbi:hypothetical protein DFQ30_009789 [Apophysomyces sp. BC1015]|nr:hypothetical protein DFQ30_009789 [Apophysomyces sp. BC1015]
MTSSLFVAQATVAAIQDLLFAIVAGSILCDVALAAVFTSSRDAARLRLRGSIKQTTPGTNLPRIQWLSLCGLAIAHLLYLWLQAAAMSGSTLGDALTMLGTVLSQSHYGAAWLIGATGVALALAASHAGAQGGQSHGNRPTTAGGAAFRVSLKLAVVGLAVYAAGKAAASHAADAGDFSITQAVHWIHIGATASWAGSVSIAAVVLPTFALSTRADGGRHLAFCERLSRTSAIALMLVVLSGLYNVAWISANASAPLAGTHYGTWLGAKLAVAALAARLRDAQRVHASGGNALSQRYLATASHLRRTVVVESALLAATLVAAATLSHMPPT